MVRQSEKLLSLQISKYLRLQYPNVIYRFDLAADMHLSLGLARRNKALNPFRGYPDLFIAEPKKGYNGLYLELKAVNVFKQDGTLKKSDHLQAQQRFLSVLQKKGYKAEFAIGFNHTKSLIDNYMGVKTNDKSKNVF